jgi:hypothetical protein
LERRDSDSGLSPGPLRKTAAPEGSGDLLQHQTIWERGR